MFSDLLFFTFMEFMKLNYIVSLPDLILGLIKLDLSLPNYSSHTSESDSTKLPFTKFKRNYDSWQRLNKRKSSKSPKDELSERQDTRQGSPIV